METTKTMSDEIKDLALALSIAQGAMENAKKDSSNPFFKSKYADLSAIINAGKEAMKNNGLAISQIMEPDIEKAIVVTLLMHKSGQWIKSIVALKPTAANPQAMGSAITYARRYGYQAILGLSAEDDDGNSASGKNNGNTADSGSKSGSTVLTECSSKIAANCDTLQNREVPAEVRRFTLDKYHKIICYPCQTELKKDKLI